MLTVRNVSWLLNVNETHDAEDRLDNIDVDFYLFIYLFTYLFIYLFIYLLLFYHK